MTCRHFAFLARPANLAFKPVLASSMVSKSVHVAYKSRHIVPAFNVVQRIYTNCDMIVIVVKISVVHWLNY